MRHVIYALGIASLGLTACDVTYPVAVVGPSDTVYRGTATATIVEGGWFQVSNGGNVCRGRYLPSFEAKQVTFPVNCTNGLSGIGTAVYDNPRSGGGNIIMQDGSTWRFIFGKGALAV
ncbi:MAG: hypothetical protein ABJL99_25285 [Aliishimia sp.]